MSIDIENDVIEYVGKRLTAAHDGIEVSGTYVQAPSSFPFVSIVENDNRIVTRMRTLNIENAVSVMYECNIYSNKVSGKKQEAKAIANTLDEAFASAGFTRTMRNQVANLFDASIYRIVCRYEAIVGHDGDGRFLVYQSGTNY